MPRLLQIGSLVCLLVTLGSCGEGYVVEPARLNVTSTETSSTRQVLDVAWEFLRGEGFEDLGRYSAMITLIEHSQMPDSARRQELSRLQREYTYLNDARNLRIVVTDYSDGDAADFHLRYKPVSEKFLEISIFNERPGGFSSDALLFYTRFLSHLKRAFGQSVVVVNDPPPTNSSEYKRITLTNEISAGMAWCVAFTCGFLVTGSASFLLLRRAKWTISVKRCVFTVANSWLAAPLAFQGGFIFVVQLPNLFAFPWVDRDFYRLQSAYALFSFSLSLLLCFLVSMRLFKTVTQAQRVEA